ncbi:hypothetical protein SBA6_40083 [Candidatus Sulfopaludibacter sp. SbA6]|nr:hypothetical protein SBA6_40083 [Candidatus Sulfopaludibacter sp. SbA6]
MSPFARTGWSIHEPGARGQGPGAGAARHRVEFRHFLRRRGSRGLLEQGHQRSQDTGADRSREGQPSLADPLGRDPRGRGSGSRQRAREPRRLDAQRRRRR